MEVYNLSQTQKILKISRGLLNQLALEDKKLPIIQKKMKRKTKIFVPEEFLAYFINRAVKETGISDINRAIKKAKYENNDFKQQIISVVNIKGGVGKTTISANLGYTFACLGKKVLIVDVDPQSSLTSYFITGEKPNKTISRLYNLYTKNKKIEKSEVEETIVNIKFENNSIDILPSELIFARQIEEIGNLVENPHRILYKIIEKIKNQYDVIIIDTPPAPGLMQRSAFYVTDKLVTVALPDSFSIDGLTDVIKESQHSTSYNQEKTKIDAIFINREKNINLHKATVDIIEEIAKDIGLEQKVYHIPESSKVSEASVFHVPLLEYQPELEMNLKSMETIIKYAVSICK